MKRRTIRSGTVLTGRDLGLLVTPMIATTEDAGTWLARALPVGTPPVRQATSGGWPMTIVHGARCFAAHLRVVDFAGGVVAHFAREEQRDQVVALVASMTPELPVRDAWRPFTYAPPAWTRADRAGQTLWIAPTSGERPVVIRVFDAVASAGAPEPMRGSAPIRLPGGLDADVVSLGGARAITQVVARDERYLYRFRLECDPASFADATRTFARVVSSLRPTWRAAADLHPFTTWKD